MAFRVFLRRPTLVPGLAILSSVGFVACGAGINAVYEGDIRFEHCMALDDNPEEKLSTRRECWDEWVEYYTFGQTRDRVDYARRRRKVLVRAEARGMSEAPDEAEPTSASVKPVLAEPTPLLPPPPTLATDAGKGPEDAAADADAAPDPGELPAATCAAKCRDTWVPCKQGCTGAPCEKKCDATYKRCMKRCF